MSHTDNQLIEKFSGQFEKEDSGCSILINSTVNNIHDMALLGLYCYLACRPPGWKIHPKHLIKHFKCSKDKVYKMLNGLIDMGLLSVKQIRDKGRFVGTLYKLHTKPCKSTDSKADLPCLEKPDTEKPDAYITKNVVNKDKNNISSHMKENCTDKEEPEKPTPPPKPDKPREENKKSRLVATSTDVANTKKIKIQEYIDVWNKHAGSIGCPLVGNNKRQRETIKRHLRKISMSWEQELTPSNFEIWLENAIGVEFYLLTKYLNRMDICLRWQHFEESYRLILAHMDN